MNLSTQTSKAHLSEEPSEDILSALAFSSSYSYVCSYNLEFCPLSKSSWERQNILDLNLYSNEKTEIKLQQDNFLIFS